MSDEKLRPIVDDRPEQEKPEQPEQPETPRHASGPARPGQNAPRGRRPLFRN